jgi:hypothetical protein
MARRKHEQAKDSFNHVSGFGSNSFVFWFGGHAKSSYIDN